MLSVVTDVVTPSKPLLKRSHTDFNSDDSPLLSPSSEARAKRLKVQFSSQNTVHELKNWEEDKSVVLVKEEVKRAFERHANGESTQYNNLCEAIATKPSSPDAPSPVLLRRYVIVLADLSGLVGRKNEDLVNSILHIEWLGRDEEFITLYRRLLASLISSYGGWAHDVLGSLVESFMSLRTSSGRLPHQSIVRRPQMLERIHGTINHILQKVPSTTSSLKSVILENFPHSSGTLKEHVDFVTNILKMISYTPFVKADIIALIIERLAKIDVQTQVDIEELEEDLEAELEEDLHKEVETLLEKDDNDPEVEEEVSDSDDESVVDEFEDPGKKRLHRLKLEVAKMDAVMDLLFAHFDPVFEKGSNAETEATLDQIIGMFIRTILPTYRSRHIQFLLFHFGQASKSLSERFVQSLIDVLLERNQPTMYKRSASAYLASFIARGAHINRDLVQYTFNKLSKELHRLRELHEKNRNCGPDLQRFGVYYTIFQALLYIFCFRWRDLLVDELEDDNFEIEDLRDKWALGVVDTFRFNIYSKTNPLKVCAPPIVNQFAVVSRQLQILVLEPKLQLNKRIRLSAATFPISDGLGAVGQRETALTAKSGESVFQLDAYFPFDPYNLPRSKRWLEGEYNIWKPIPGMGFEHGDSDSEEDEDDADEEEEQYDEPTETDSVGSR